MWLASLDLTKAFDKILHSYVARSLLSAGADATVVKAIQKVYQQLLIYVQTDPGVNGRDFRVRRGVRQGDPLSPLLFINVVKDLMESLQRRWEERGYGPIVGAWGDEVGRLTHLIFADDLTLVAKSSRV